MSTIGSRLEEERKRIGLNQEDFGTSCGVGKHAQINYEKGRRSPDGDYFEKAHGLGVDILYVIAGIRSPLMNEETKAHFAGPGPRVAAEIAAMDLDEEGADVLLRMASLIKN
jgi:transcriptional regulator with XRE-family HTH domain